MSKSFDKIFALLVCLQVNIVGHKGDVLTLRDLLTYAFSIIWTCGRWSFDISEVIECCLVILIYEVGDLMAAGCGISLGAWITPFPWLSNVRLVEDTRPLKRLLHSFLLCYRTDTRLMIVRICNLVLGSAITFTPSSILTFSSSYPRPPFIDQFYFFFFRLPIS